jgi:hypothetical protein
MAKRETKETYKDTKALGSDIKNQYQTAITGSQDLANQQSSSVDQQREGLSSYYGQMMKPPTAFTPQSYTAQTVSTRAIDDAALKAMQPALHDFSTTGGFTPGREESVMGVANQLKNNGGLSDENIARIRGNGGYDEFAKTGGYTPEAIANIKAQALSPIGSYATGTRDELARRAAIQGGYTPGFDAASRQLRRDTARNIADTSLNANVSIQDKINQGRQWGIGGLSGAETQIGGLKQHGLEAGGGMELQLQSLISQYRAQGLSLEEANAKAQADIDAANVSNELAASSFNAGQQNQAGMFNAQNANQGQLFNIQNAQDQYARGVGGLQNLQDQTLSQLVGERDRQQQLLGSSAQGQLGALGIQSDLAKQPGVGGNIISGIGAAAGLASNLVAPGISGLAKGAIGSIAPAVQSGYNAGWE